jgi:excisionase family DNA binding protein
VRSEATCDRSNDRIAVRAREAARLLGIGRSLLAELTAANEIPSFRAGSARLYPLADLQRWVAERATRPAGEKGGVR